MTVTRRADGGGGRIVRIGCPVGAWGDSDDAVGQMLREPHPHYLMFEFLAEVTMALLARARAKNPRAGYVPDFVDLMKVHLSRIRELGIRVVTNAGGIHPEGCAEAVRAIARESGLGLKVAVVTGDDLLPEADRLRSGGLLREWRTGAALPEASRPLSLNAYLGAFPIARALDAGADVVITGRVVDSALALGPLVHEFGWTTRDLDRLAAGTLCGHLLECGGQATGGNFTDWRSVEGWDSIGYPVAECRPDGTFVVTKPQGTGGLVSVDTLAEQMLYEIDDPRAYLVPDVALDLTGVTLRQVGPDRVEVSGARGGPPPATLKVTGTWHGGYRSMTTVTIAGREAGPKAQRTGEAILAKTRRMFRERGFADYTETSIEVLGTECTYGPHARPLESREVVLKIGVRHPQREALELFAREIAPANMCMTPGLTGFFAGRPSVSPVPEIRSFLVPRGDVPVAVTLDGERLSTADAQAPAGADRPTGRGADAARSDVPEPAPGPTVEVPLHRLAHARSGDKGDDALIAVIARDASLYPVLRAALTRERVAAYMAHVAKGPVERHDVPGIGALTFVLHEALGGGGVASLRIDPLGKAFGQMLLDCAVPVPAQVAREHGWHVP